MLSVKHVFFFSNKMGPTLSVRLDTVAVRQIRNDAHITRSKIQALSQQLRRLGRNDRYVSRSNAMFALKECGVYSGDTDGGKNNGKPDYALRIIFEIIQQSVHPHSGKVDVAFLCPALGCLVIGSVIDALELAYRVTDFMSLGTLSLDELTDVLCAVATCLEMSDLSGEFSDPPEVVRSGLSKWLRETQIQMIQNAPNATTGGMKLDDFLQAVQKHPVVIKFL